MRRRILVSANTVIWWNPTTSLEIHEQANARIVWPGQTSRTWWFTHRTPRLSARGMPKGKMLGDVDGVEKTNEITIKQLTAFREVVRTLEKRVTTIEGELGESPR